MRSIQVRIRAVAWYGLAGLLACLPWMDAQAASTVMIWPIDPVLESGQHATALWLENRGDSATLLQLRIFAWRQQAGGEQYQAQSALIGSPPMMQIPPGKKQLIRLINTVEPPAGQELAYRIIVDEIPTPEAPAAASKASVGVRFQMRYSIPLFVYGKGLWLKQEPAKHRDPAMVGQPSLSWRLIEAGGASYLQVDNRGAVHARLTQLAFVQGGRRIVVSKGLFGYVLAHSAMRWPLAEIRVPTGATLEGIVNGGAHSQTILRRL